MPKTLPPGFRQLTLADLQPPHGPPARRLVVLRVLPFDPLINEIILRDTARARMAGK